jgi:membrane protein
VKAGICKKIALQYLRWPVLLLVVMAVLSVLYRVGPSRHNAKWRWLTLGSTAAALVWVAASMLFSWYVAQFNSYNRLYGSLGAIIGFMTWIWLSIFIILLGATLNAETEHQTARDSTLGPPKPMGARGATMADHVGKSTDEL